MSLDDVLWDSLLPGDELTIVKTHYTPGRADYSYPARVIETDRPGWIALEAHWALDDMDVDGILYETDGVIIEYFSPQQRFNIFHVFRRSGESSGFYANVTELPRLERNDQGVLVLTWIDCWLDVIKLPTGELKLLDEDEFEESGISESNPGLAMQIRQAAVSAINLLKSDEWKP